MRINKAKPLVIAGLVLTLSGYFQPASSQEAPHSPATRYMADEKSLAKHYNAPDWFRDAKLGI